MINGKQKTKTPNMTYACTVARKLEYLKIPSLTYYILEVKKFRNLKRATEPTHAQLVYKKH